MSPHELPTRPRAETYKVEELLSMAQRGTLRIPAFQRKLQWKSADVAALFDSVVRGFPIGSLLLWRRKVDDGVGGVQRFGSVQLPAPQLDEGLLVVDGQQRVVAFVGALLHPDPIKQNDVHAIWVNLRTEQAEFSRRPQKLDDDGMLPLNIFSDHVRLLEWSDQLKAGTAKAALVKRAFQIFQRIQNYVIPAYVVSDVDETALRLIFTRVNSAGKPLSAAQVFEAIAGTKEQSHPLEALARRLDDATGFGLLSNDWLLRCLKAVNNSNPRHTYLERNLGTADALERTEAALKKGLFLLINDANIPHAQVLPYRGPLIILTRLFDKHPELNDRDRTLLVRWIWRGALSGEHANTSNERIAKQLQDIDDDSPSVCIQRLLQRTPKVWQSPDAMRPWYGQSVVTRLFVLVQLGLVRRAELIDLQEIQQWLSRKDLGELFLACDHFIDSRFELGPLFSDSPSPGVKKLIGNSIAARVWQPGGSPSILSIDPEERAALVLNDRMMESLITGDTKEFLLERSLLLKEELEKCIEIYAAPHSLDRPSIETLFSLVNL